MSSAVALYILGISEMYEVEGVELYWTWIGKLMVVVCLSVKLLKGKSDFTCYSEVVVGVLIWL